VTSRLPCIGPRRSWTTSYGFVLMDSKEQGILDHMAYTATGLAGYIVKLKARDIKYDLRRVPEGGYAAGIWQVFFNDPNGAKVELDFAKEETAPAGA
jgi:hypothetical protein